MRLGICGLPHSGKTTVFNALTGARSAVGGYEDRSHVASVDVPDERLDTLAEMFAPRKRVPAAIDYIDIPGVRADAAKDDLVRVLTALRDADALVECVRFFEHPAVPHPLGSLDPIRDSREFQTELIVADLDIVERRIKTIEKEMKRPRPDSAHLHAEYDVLVRCGRALEEETALRRIELSPEEEKHVRNFQFLSLKPVITVLNVGEDVFRTEEAEEKGAALDEGTIIMCGELEMEIGDLSPEERPEFLQGLGIGEPCSRRLIHASYQALGLRSFFTIGDKEVRAWTIHAGENALAAAGRIHTDMERGFIRAEVVSFESLVKAGGLKEAKAAGKLRLEGKGYTVRDGDVITFRFNV